MKSLKYDPRGLSDGYECYCIIKKKLINTHIYNVIKIVEIHQKKLFTFCHISGIRLSYILSNTLSRSVENINNPSKALTKFYILDFTVLSNLLNL